jgi:UDP-N-acetylmuramate dehydrogenase
LKRSHEIVVRARFRLTRGNKKKIQERIDEIIMHRNQRHPNDGKSAGCFFKNIPDATQPYGKLPAGKLLEEAGAKELQVGGAKVFENHANIIVNTGNATSADIRALANLMKERVRQKFGITLEEEVIQVGTF